MWNAAPPRHLRLRHPARSGLAQSCRRLNCSTAKEEVEATSRINQYLDDNAFRKIALGENYFRLLSLEYHAPTVCAP